MPKPEPGPPRMLGRYHLFDPVEEDALGVLYLARLEGPSGFQRWAVVRVVHASLEDDRELGEAFYEAARVAALVQHPNVAVTFDVGTKNGSTWVAREYLHGESVSDLIAQVILAKTPVPWDIACRIVADAALGVDTLHDVAPASPPIGFLEGVLTPARAVVTYDGKTKVVEGCLPLLGGRPTLDADVLAYRAPELADHEVSGARADVFALGVVLWELCAGRRLFGGGDEAETRARVEARAVPFLRASVRCPSMVDEVIRRAIAREPEGRHPSCRVLARELEACLVSKGLIVTDDDVGRYMLGVFADRFEEREANLISAANVTEVFDRDEIRAKVAAAQVASQKRPRPPGDSFVDALPPEGEDNADTSETPDATTAMIPPLREEAATPLVTPAASGLEPPMTSPVPLLRRIGSGFDEVTTAPGNERPARLASTLAGVPAAPLTGPLPPRSPESQVFVGGDLVPPSSGSFPDSLGDLVAETVRTPALSFEEEGTTAALAQERAAGTVQLPVAAGTQRPDEAASRAVATARLPSLSAVLIAHEPKSRLPLPALAVGFVAVVGIVAVLVFRVLSAGDTPTSPTMPVATVPPSPAPPTPASAAADPTPPRPPGSTAPSVPVAATVTAPGEPVTARAQSAAPPVAVPESTPPRRTTSRVSAPASNKTGLLTVFCTPACDDVLDGGRSLGPSPVFKLPVSVGSHRLTLVGSDPPTRKVVTVLVNEDDTTVVREAIGAGP